MFTGAWLIPIAVCGLIVFFGIYHFIRSIIGPAEHFTHAFILIAGGLSLFGVVALCYHLLNYLIYGVLSIGLLTYLIYVYVHKQRKNKLPITSEGWR